MLATFHQSFSSSMVTILSRSGWSVKSTENESNEIGLSSSLIQEISDSLTEGSTSHDARYTFSNALNCFKSVILLSNAYSVISWSVI